MKPVVEFMQSEQGKLAHGFDLLQLNNALADIFDSSISKEKLIADGTIEKVRISFANMDYRERFIKAYFSKLEEIESSDMKGGHNG